MTLLEPVTSPSSAAPPRRSPWFWLGIALAIVPVEVGIWFLAVFLRRSEELAGWLLLVFSVLAVIQVVLCLVSVGAGIRARRAGPRGLGAAFVGLLAAVGAGVGGFYGVVVGMFAAGGGWGRPLRVRGRQLHPELRAGTDWTRGDRPDPQDLDEPTRRALEGLWLHDAQKEHASVPAFARVSWMLAACGAPAELLAWSQRAALEEIEHAELCFALAAGYGGREHTVEPMPELLVGGLDLRGDALVALASESLADGCLLEDFNADIAAECAAVCEEPTTARVLEQIAREERSHAEFSWAVVHWTLAHAGATVGPALARAIERLPRYRRPTAESWRMRPLVRRADPEKLRRHGRLPDERWADVWGARLRTTMDRAGVLLGGAAALAGTP